MMKGWNSSSACGTSDKSVICHYLVRLSGYFIYHNHYQLHVTGLEQYITLTYLNFTLDGFYADKKYKTMYNYCKVLNFPLCNILIIFIQRNDVDN